MMDELDGSVARVLELLRGAGELREVLALTTARRTLDLSGLSPAAQAGLLAERAWELEPSKDALAARIAAARAAGRQLVVKFTVEPFGTDFHLGNVVPLLVLDRLRRMNNDVAFVVGDVTAKAGDASGSVSDAPALTDSDIARNLAAYLKQVQPFADFSSIRLRHNSDWLNEVRLPQLQALAAHVPVSSLPHNEAGTLAAFLYPLAKAMDSLELRADIEVGGTYQTANMALCRHLMAAVDVEPQIALSTPLITGVDGKSLMSASRGNHVPLTATAQEMFTRVSSVPDELVVPYLRALTEWRDAEIEAARALLPPAKLRALAAADITAAVHGVDAAMSEFISHTQSVTKEGTVR